MQLGSGQLGFAQTLLHCCRDSIQERLPVKRHEMTSEANMTTPAKASSHGDWRDPRTVSQDLVRDTFPLRFRTVSQIVAHVWTCRHWQIFDRQISEASQALTCNVAIDVNFKGEQPICQRYIPDIKTLRAAGWPCELSRPMALLAFDRKEGVVTLMVRTWHESYISTNVALKEAVRRSCAYFEAAGRR